MILIEKEIMFVSWKHKNCVL